MTLHLRPVREEATAHTPRRGAGRGLGLAWALGVGGRQPGPKKHCGLLLPFSLPREGRALGPLLPLQRGPRMDVVTAEHFRPSERPVGRE